MLTRTPRYSIVCQFESGEESTTAAGVASEVALQADARPRSKPALTPITCGWRPERWCSSWPLSLVVLTMT
jgi:hypothetical protein